MRNLLVDAGPFIALFDKNDQHHALARKRLDKVESELATTWPVVTEVSYMLSFSVRAQLDFLHWIELGAVTIHDLNRDDLDFMISLMAKYKDVPMDLADASLVALSEKLDTNRIFTIDSDFQIFRNRFKNYLKDEFSEKDSKS